MLDGYSKKSLVEKLGIKPGFRMFIIHEPTTYWKELGKLPEGSVVSKRLSSQFNFIHYFSTEQSELKKVFPSLKESIYRTRHQRRSVIKYRIEAVYNIRSCW
jgi:hypothetical protein